LAPRAMKLQSMVRVPRGDDCSFMALGAKERDDAPRYPDHRDSTTGTELRIASVPFPPYPDIRLSLPSSRRVARFFDGFRPQLITTEVVTAGAALRVHHASDVLAGGALGLAAAVAAAYLLFLR